MEWELLVDDSSTKSGCGARLVLKPPVGDKMEYTIKFEFLGSNNEAEYEPSSWGFNSVFWQGQQQLTPSLIHNL